MASSSSSASTANLLSVLVVIMGVSTSLMKPVIAFELLNNVCLPTLSNTSTSPNLYTANAKTLLKFLTSRSTLASTGFSSGAAGQPHDHPAYGLINCLPGVSSSDCKACGHQATRDALSLCPGAQGAVLWYDSCLLKYADTDFLGTVDTGNQFQMTSPEQVSGDPARFEARVKDLLTKLSKKAAGGPTLFATGKAVAEVGTTVYGMVECTRDLSGGECGSCLEEVVGDFSNCCGRNKGGRVIAASCMFRFELYPF